MPKIQANEINLYYEEYGQGPTIVFVAGFTAEYSIWEQVAKICAAQYHVVIFDNRGVGRSDCTSEPFTADLLASDTALLCEALNIKQAFFVGSSMGGQIVMRLAYKFPNLVKSIVISNSVMKLGVFSLGYQLYLDVILNLIRHEQRFNCIDIYEVYVKLNARWIFSNSFLEKPEVLFSLINKLKANNYRITELGFINQRNVGLTYDATTWLHKITCPCLVIASNSDAVFPATEVKKISSTIPNSKYFFFEGDVGHFPFIEQPAVFAKTILNFFSLY